MARETAAEREAREAAEQADALAEQSAADASLANEGLDDDQLTVKGLTAGPVVFTRGGVEVAKVNVEGTTHKAKDAEERDLLLQVPGAHI